MRFSTFGGEWNTWNHNEELGRRELKPKSLTVGPFVDEHTPLQGGAGNIDGHESYSESRIHDGGEKMNLSLLFVVGHVDEA